MITSIKILSVKLILKFLSRGFLKKATRLSNMLHDEVMFDKKEKLSIRKCQNRYVYHLIRLLFRAFVCPSSFARGKHKGMNACFQVSTPEPAKQGALLEVSQHRKLLHSYLSASLEASSPAE